MKKKIYSIVICAVTLIIAIIGTVVICCYQSTDYSERKIADYLASNAAEEESYPPSNYAIIGVNNDEFAAFDAQIRADGYSYFSSRTSFETECNIDGKTKKMRCGFIA